MAKLFENTRVKLRKPHTSQVLFAVAFICFKIKRLQCNFNDIVDDDD